MHPTWRYKLWTDEEALDLVATHYPQYLNMYIAYPSGIYRADFIRYCILDTYGGIYADLDFEAVQPLDDILNQNSFIVGHEPLPHTYLIYDKAFLVSNAIIASVPGHPIWQHVFSELVDSKNISNLLYRTGPFMLNNAILAYLEDHVLSKEWPITAASSQVLYPLYDISNNEVLRMQCARRNLLQNQQIMCNQLTQLGFTNPPLTPSALAVHHWVHTYHGTIANDKVLSITSIVDSHRVWIPSKPPPRPQRQAHITPIPRIIHQLSSTALSPDEKEYSRLCASKHFSWEHRHWTLGQVRDLIASSYSSHLPVYDAYASDYDRVLAARYFILHAHGGVFVDSDVECVQSFESLTSQYSLVLAHEPLEHTYIIYDADYHIGDAVIASSPGHVFWDAVFVVLTEAGPGPSTLDHAYELYERMPEPQKNSPLYIAPPYVFYPLYDSKNAAVQATCTRTRQSSRQNAICARLRKVGLYKQEIGPRSLAACHWLTARA